MNEHLSPFPRASIDGVDAVELLARATGGPPVVTRVIDAPIDTVWTWLADVESSIPAFDRTVQSVRIEARAGNLLTMSVRGRFQLRMRFSCHLGEHHWVMVGPRRSYCVAAGVRALGPGQTLYAQFEVVPRRIGRFLHRFTARHVERDAAAVKRLAEQRVGRPP